MKLIATMLGVLLLSCTMTVSAADNNGKKNSKQQSETGVVVQAGVSIFSQADRNVIQQYVRALPTDNLPPGLAKRGGSLPPGLAKQLRKNGKLPPGLQKRLTAFPLELERRLPPLAPELNRVFIEGRAVIHNSRTGAVLDVLIVF